MTLYDNKLINKAIKNLKVIELELNWKLQSTLTGIGIKINLTWMQNNNKCLELKL
jgi:hypothetical protein